MVQQPVRIASRGICCSVGFYAAAAIAAIRANVNNFCETSFIDYQGEPIRGAMLYQTNIWGEQRLQYMFDTALEECLYGLGAAGEEPLPILVLGPEQIRGSGYRDWAERCRNTLARGGHPQSRLFSLGKAGIGTLVREAQKIFSMPKPPDYVIALGLDSYFEPAAIQQFLADDRLYCSANSDGFIPGEAACAVALTPLQGDDKALWIDGIGEASEKAGIMNDEPLLAQGLTKAIRGAIEEAGYKVSGCAFHASGVNGEQWYFKEAALALTRVLEERVESFPHYLVCQATGETGAACGPLTLAWMAEVMGRRDGPGTQGILHFSNDDALRCALAVQYR